MPYIFSFLFSLLFKNVEECLWGAILNRLLPFLSDLELLLGDMGG